MPSSPNEPFWLTAEHLVRINQLEVEKTGEPHLVRDPGLVEMAAYRPQNVRWYGGEEDVVRLAIELLMGVAQNHPFEQGNKRTALTAALVFIDQNGYSLDFGRDTTWLGELVLAVIEHRTDLGQLEQAIRGCIVDPP
ncbi:type II toxin-antitoxin system death-on-curing family toxin [Mycobacterium sp. KBS0706]|uniref:type II toxin-antitoxin system death-on-curing family toxin n=1 Tax=Mycobacterium sp. KBS0706 TaxID=2578109 RepID=UPI00110FF034|nr:type II toxin-antitoxin system death-on-curing family toxin [Mycobacterium sp. KBS0706]TSD85618.1 type II toxin-antitoxin system death-on-curing family toxin [Mycobacterium sp. KBS0706]